MKRLNKVFLILALVTFSACNEQTEVIDPPVPEFISVAIPDYLKSSNPSGRISSGEIEIQEVEVEITTEEGKKVKGVVRVTMPSGDEETLISFEVTSNILTETGADADFWVNALDTNNARVLGIGACLKNCGHEDVHNPKSYRGGCWAELALKVIAVAIILL